MELYISGIGCVSPQTTFDNTRFLKEVRNHITQRILCVEPDYNSFFDPASVRRLSRVAKFSNTAAVIALKDAGITTPDAISTGSGYALLENSERFLKIMIESNEMSVSPTAFIQSTHNSISSAIALITGCHAHNNTFSQKGLSFESALLDAMLVIKENNYSNMLVGTYDELADITFALLKRMNIYRNEPTNTLESLKHPGKGIVAGEGAAFFVLSPNASDKAYGVLKDVQMIHHHSGYDDLKRKAENFLGRNNLSAADVDVVLSGLCGDKELDADTEKMNQEFLASSSIAGFKHLCGEYMTASSFAFYLAAQMMKTQTVPEVLLLNSKNRLPKNVLIYNAYKNDCALMLFKAC